MPVAPKAVTPTLSEEAVVRLARAMLGVARGNYIIWGRMLQGQAALDTMPVSDLQVLIDVIRRRLSNVV